MRRLEGVQPRLKRLVLRPQAFELVLQRRGRRFPLLRHQAESAPDAGEESSTTGDRPKTMHVPAASTISP